MNTEYCPGNCNDAEVYHDGLTTNTGERQGSDEHSGCGEFCRTRRFEGRCHCGRKYAPVVDRQALEEIEHIVAFATQARNDLARNLNMPFTRVGITITKVPVELWDAIPAEKTSSFMKRVLAGERDIVGIAFMRS